MLPKTSKRRYSGKVRVLGAGIILLELATVVLLFLAVYSNALMVTSVFSSLTSVRGSGFAFQNVTINNQPERAFVLPRITNNAYLPVAVSINAALQDPKGQIVGTPLSESSTIAPGQSQPLVLVLPSLYSTSDISSIHFSFEISSVYGLVGGRISGTVSK